MAAGMTDFKLNRKGFVDLLTSGGVSDYVGGKAQAVLAAAKADPHDDTYDYENSLHIEVSTTSGGKGALPRVRYRVISDSDHAWIVEAKFGVLARALDAAK